MTPSSRHPISQTAPDSQPDSQLDSQLDSQSNLSPHSSLSLLTTHNLAKYFAHNKTKTVLFENVNVIFEQGKTYALTGASGSGKSTFMHLLTGLESPCTGTVTYNDRNIATLSGYEKTTFLSSAVGLMFQQPYLISELTVLENVIIPGLISGRNKADCTHTALELLAQLGLEHKAVHKPGSLSGGQQQRVALARALFNKPAFLLADEPTGSLDTKTGQEMLALLLLLQKKYSMGIIISTHDTSIAKQMSTHYHFANQLLAKT
jgi:ABC-type lipoprotein export system ATPase subunit